jgi:hypothetical protein
MRAVVLASSAEEAWTRQRSSHAFVLVLVLAPDLDRDDAPCDSDRLASTGVA